MVSADLDGAKPESKVDSEEELTAKCWFKYRTVDSHFLRSDYRPENDRDVDLISGGKLYFARRDMLNDEAEMRPAVRFSRAGGVSKEDVESYLQSRFAGRREAEIADHRSRLLAEIATPGYVDRYRTEAERTIDEMLSTTVVCSFCRRPDIPSIWAHYARNYSGYALGFDFSVPMLARVDSFGDTRSVGLNIVPVVYTDEYPEVDADELIVGTDGNQFARAALHTKSDCWRHEQEARMAIFSAEPGGRVYPPECLKMVVLGSQMSKPDRAKIIGLAKTRSNPAIFQATSERGNFNLRLVRIS